MRAEAWEGFDFLTIDSGINPLVASYTGAPHMARGVDPSGSARNAVDFWNGLNASAATPTVGASLLPSLMPNDDTLKKVGYGALGGLLAIVLITLGILIIWKG